MEGITSKISLDRIFNELSKRFEIISDNLLNIKQFKRLNSHAKMAQNYKEIPDIFTQISIYPFTIVFNKFDDLYQLGIVAGRKSEYCISFNFEEDYMDIVIESDCLTSDNRYAYYDYQFTNVSDNEYNLEITKDDMNLLCVTLIDYPQEMIEIISDILEAGKQYLFERYN